MFGKKLFSGDNFLKPLFSLLDHTMFRIYEYYVRDIYSLTNYTLSSYITKLNTLLK